MDVKPIQKLEQAVINRIAAGEIIQRPASALKEMIENSLDAKATSVQITVKEGGLKYIQIQDNGHGIRKGDLDIACERFTTSKLREFNDLQSIETYGFRGEALASISHVAHLSITTRTADSKCAFQVTYGDGKPKGSPRPCAGNQGTIIVVPVEDLFYNVSIRRKAFQSPATEYSKIAEVVGRYAIHNATVGFSLKKQSDIVSDIKTPINSTIQDNIRIVFGAEISRDLLDVTCEKEEMKFKMCGYVSNLNCNSKKTILLLFINHRLVESSVIKKTIDAIYSAYLPKNKLPFVYLSLEIAAQNVDVNVHPTKQEVHFLHETDIINEIQKTIEMRLLNTGQSRTLYLQTLLPTAKESAVPTTGTVDVNDSPKPRIGSVSAHHLVRTDNRAQKLDAFLLRPTAANEAVDEQRSDTEDHVHQTPGVTPRSDSGASQTQSQMSVGNRKTTFANVVKENEVHLTSILNLRKDIENACDQDLRGIFREYTFVGAVNREYALVQHQTKLYLLNVHELSQQLFYQIMMHDFGNYSTCKLSEPASIYDLIMLALDAPVQISGWDESLGPKDNFARYATDHLVSKSEMLLDVFAMKIEESGNLLAFPYLLDNYTPALEGLPIYLLRLTTEVNWETEQECFESFCIETSRFYAFSKESLPEPDKNPEENTEEINGGLESSQSNVPTSSSWTWVVEHVLFPAFRSGFKPAKENATNGNVLLVAVLSDLYKVFERC